MKSDIKILYHTDGDYVPLEELERLETELAEAKSVIEFYADKENYQWLHQLGRMTLRDVDGEYLKLVHENDLKTLTGGKRARAFLGKHTPKN